MDDIHQRGKKNQFQASESKRINWSDRCGRESTFDTGPSDWFGYLPRKEWLMNEVDSSLSLLKCPFSLIVPPAGDYECENWLSAARWSTSGSLCMMVRSTKILLATFWVTKSKHQGFWSLLKWSTSIGSCAASVLQQQRITGMCVFRVESITLACLASISACFEEWRLLHGICTVWSGLAVSMHLDHLSLFVASRLNQVSQWNMQVIL